MPNIRKSLIAALAGGMAVLTGLSELAPTNSDGRVLFKKIKSTDYVVLEEQDPTVKGLIESTNNIVVGGSAKTKDFLSVVVGAPMTGREQWKTNFVGDAEGSRMSVVVGASAKGNSDLSVAVGSQANVHGLHGDSGIKYHYTKRMMNVVKTTDADGNTTFTTNVTDSVEVEVDTGKYEKLPTHLEPVSWTMYDWKTSSEDGITTTTYYYEERFDYLYDMSYVDSEEMSLYDTYIFGGQGNWNLMDALYGVAVGYRAYVFGYHGVAYGHYTHVSRPWGVALGSESHVYSEGSMGVGYDTDIATNSPYSMAIGLNATVPSGMTNAIVIGMGDARTRESSGVSNRPSAVKSNSINLVYHGNGLEDMYLDGVSMKERIGSEVEVVGSAIGTASEIKNGIEHATGLDKDNNNIVLWSGDGIRLYTSDYTDGMSSIKKGSLEKVFINDVSLSEIISSSSGSGQSNPELETYRTTVKNAASEALNSLNSASNLGDIKNTLTTFLNTIK